MKRQPNLSPFEANILNKVILTENKLIPALSELFDSVFYHTLPEMSQLALRDFINGIVDPALPAYEQDQFQYKFGHLARWTANLKTLNARLAQKR